MLSSDVLVVGGGVVGLSAAYELARNGLSVHLIDQQQVGREASWAGAGMLPPGNSAFAQTPEQTLRSASHELWPDWVASVRTDSGIDPEYRSNGAIEIRFGDGPALNTDGPIAGDLMAEARRWQQQGVQIETLSETDLRSRYPHLSKDVSCAYWQPEHRQIRNPRHLLALRAAATKQGVSISEGAALVNIGLQKKAVGSKPEPIGATSESYVVQTTTGPTECRFIVLATGAWTQLVAQACLGSRPNADVSATGNQVPRIIPLRGQMALLRLPYPAFSEVIQWGPRYLVPRLDGRVLIGSTEEVSGFVKENTPDGVAALLNFAVRVVPALAHAQIERTWAGLRPFAPGGIPYIGELPETPRVLVAAGHFRSGLQMSPITARLLKEIVLGQPSSFDLSPFGFNRSDGGFRPTPLPQ